MSALHDAHDINAWLLIALNAAAGGWCLAAHQWPRLRSVAMWVFVALAQLTTFTQAGIGAPRGHRPRLCAMRPTIASALSP